MTSPETNVEDNLQTEILEAAARVLWAQENLVDATAFFNESIGKFDRLRKGYGPDKHDEGSQRVVERAIGRITGEIIVDN